MSYHGIIQDILAYIDGNLTGRLDAETIAGKAGFSPYHFQRVFQWHTGCSVMGYVRARRLAFAIAELSSGKKVIDIALEYGFETHSGFSKAFKRRYGVSPEIYRLRASAGRPPLPDILLMNNYLSGGIIMEPIFVALPEIKLAGYRLVTTNDDGASKREIPAFWSAYLADGRMERLHGMDFVKSHDEYGACFAEDPDTGEFPYVIGVEVKESADIPAEFHACAIPPATYAVFSTPPASQAEFSGKIQGTWQYIMNEWFASSGYEYAPGCTDFELYKTKCTGSDDNICEIHIPVIRKKA